MRSESLVSGKRTLFSIAALRKSLLVRNALWLLVGSGLRASIQGIYFVLIARALGPDGYGAFAGVVALVALASPFSGLGMGNILIKNVARDRETFGESWGTGVVAVALSGTLLLLLIVIASALILPSAIPVVLVVVVSLSDILFLKLVDLSGQAFQAVQQLRETAALPVMVSVFRLFAAIVLLIAGSSSPITWGMLYCVTSAIGVVVAIGMVHSRLCAPRFRLAAIDENLKEGLTFSVSLAAQNAYNDLDKTMLASLSTLGAAGIYAAAYRIVDVSFTPVRALLFASYARFFEHGAGGVKSAFAFARRLLPAATTYGIIASAGLFAGAGLLPAILGSRYVSAADALRWLALLPLLKTGHYFVADTLTGSGYQWLRSAIQVLVAAVNVGLNLWLIPLYSWRGAAWASLASDGLLAVGLWLAFWAVYPRGSSA